jgi:hypothetical protein
MGKIYLRIRVVSLLTSRCAQRRLSILTISEVFLAFLSLDYTKQKESVMIKTQENLFCCVLKESLSILSQMLTLYPFSLLIIW